MDPAIPSALLLTSPSPPLKKSIQLPRYFPPSRNIFLESDDEEEDKPSQRDSGYECDSDELRPQKIFQSRLNRNIFLDSDDEEDTHLRDVAPDLEVSALRDEHDPFIANALAPEPAAAAGDALDENRDSASLRDLPYYSRNHPASTSADAQVSKISFVPILPVPLRNKEMEAKRRTRLYQMPWMQAFVDIFPSLKASAPMSTQNEGECTRERKQRPRGPRQLFIPRLHAPNLEPATTEGYHWPPTPRLAVPAPVVSPRLSRSSAVRETAPVYGGIGPEAISRF